MTNCAVGTLVGMSEQIRQQHPPQLTYSDEEQMVGSLHDLIKPGTGSGCMISDLAIGLVFVRSRFLFVTYIIIFDMIYRYLLGIVIS